MYGNNEKLKWVNVITETGGNQLWVGTETGLWRVGVEKLEPVYRDSIQGIVREILSDEKGNLYIGSGDGVWIRKADEKLERVILDERTLSPDNAVVAMCREKTVHCGCLPKEKCIGFLSTENRRNIIRIL